MQSAYLIDEPISRLGPLPIVTVSPSDSVMDALTAMQREKHGCVVVCDGKSPVGVITERDILRRIGTAQPLDVRASEVISGSVWSLSMSDTVHTAIRTMCERQCRHLVVVSETGELQGVLSVKQIVHAFVEHFPSSVYNLPPDPDPAQTTREGA